MNSFQVITFVAFAWSMLVLLLECTAQQSSKQNNVDKKCLNPPPNDVDPMECCKMPALLDVTLIQNCASKEYGDDAIPSKNQSEPAFAPHIRVGQINIYTVFFFSKFQQFIS